LIRKIIKKLFAQKNEVIEKVPQSLESIIFQPEQFVQIGSIISLDNPEVVKRLKLFVDDKKSYFKIYENEILERGLEEGDEISPEIALIDTLLSEKKIVYVDWKTEAHHVLSMLNDTVSGALSTNEGYQVAYNVYLSKGRSNTISNFLDMPEFHPKLQSVVRNSGYQLVYIDEGSDSYALTLVGMSRIDEFKSIASSIEINIKYYEG
jgi:hypothetical protein